MTFTRIDPDYLEEVADNCIASGSPGPLALQAVIPDGAVFDWLLSLSWGRGEFLSTLSPSESCLYLLFLAEGIRQGLL